MVYSKLLMIMVHFHVPFIHLLKISSMVMVIDWHCIMSKMSQVGSSLGVHVCLPCITSVYGELSIWTTADITIKKKYIVKRKKTSEGCFASLEGIYSELTK